MGTELKPIPGQPGLFFEMEPDGLGATRYAGTQVFKRTSRRTKLNGLDEIQALEATRYGGTQTFQRTTRRTHLGELGFQPSQSTDIQPGTVAGIRIDLNVYVKQVSVSQAVLDNAYRSAAAQLGYDVGTSVLTSDSLVWGWKKDGDVWTAVVTKGPEKFLGREGELYSGTVAPTSKDLDDAPTAVEQYTLIIRPRDGVLTAAKITALKTAMNTAAASVRASVPGVTIEQLLTTQGVPGIFNIGIWLGVIAAGTASLLALRGRDQKAKKARAPRRPGMFTNPFKGRRI